MCLKNATNKNSVRLEKTVVHTRICNARSLSPFIWSAIEMLATASEVAKSPNRDAYSADENEGKPKTGGRKMQINIPTEGAKIKRAKTLTEICGKSLFTEVNLNCPPRIISENHGAMLPSASNALKINRKFPVENRQPPKKGRTTTHKSQSATP